VNGLILSSSKSACPLTHLSLKRLCHQQCCSNFHIINCILLLHSLPGECWDCCESLLSQTGLLISSQAPGRHLRRRPNGHLHLGMPLHGRLPLLSGHLRQGTALHGHLSHPSGHLRQGIALHGHLPHPRGHLQQGTALHGHLPHPSGHLRQGTALHGHLPHPSGHLQQITPQHGRLLHPNGPPTPPHGRLVPPSGQPGRPRARHLPGSSLAHMSKPPAARSPSHLTMFLSPSGKPLSYLSATGKASHSRRISLAARMVCDDQQRLCRTFLKDMSLFTRC
jgi:hypothetical protein